MTEWQNVQVVVEDRVALLTIDRPPVNAFSEQVVTELDEALDTFLADDAVEAIVVTGAGEKAFVAGADIGEIKAVMEEGPAAVRRFVERGQDLFLKIERSSKPIIAAVNGFCLGGGMELALACHIRLCSEQAVLGQPEIGLGIIPGWGATQRLPRLVGPGKALELILSGKRIGAEEAYRIGLVESVVGPDALLTEARDLVAQIVSHSSISVAAALKAVVGARSEELEAGLALEKEQFVSLADSHDAHEGLSAFLEKREPAFEDR